jgi:hypothetical protein
MVVVVVVVVVAAASGPAEGGPTTDAMEEGMETEWMGERGVYDPCIPPHPTPSGRVGGRGGGKPRPWTAGRPAGLLPLS